MSVSDPISDMLTVIRNACKAGHKRVEIPSSKMKTEIARVLLKEKFIANYKSVEDNKQGILRIFLKYDDEETSVITGLARVSTPGKRVYLGAKKLPKVIGGLGIAIVSTSSGLMTEKEARSRGLGGEVVCKVW
jgi:small subunit ribosomal protein S8